MKKMSPSVGRSDFVRAGLVDEKHRMERRMGKYVLAYNGGAEPETDAEGQRVLAAWMSWFETLGTAVIDMGNPFTASVIVTADGGTHPGASSGLSGYSIVMADSLEAAARLAATCPIFENGGGVDVYEAHEM